MQNSIKIILIGICICLFSSCVHYPKLAKPANPIKILTLQELDGRYLFTPACDPFYFPIDHLVVDYNATYGPIEDNEVIEGELKRIDNETLHLTVFRNGINVSKHEIKGQLKGGYFALDGQRYTDKGDGPIILVPEYQKTLIEMGPNKELIVHTRNTSYLKLFGIPIGADTFELLNHQIKRKSD